MKWHKISRKNRPKEDEWVLVSFLHSNGRYNYGCIVATIKTDDESDVAWWDGNMSYPIDKTDYWTYFELPEG